MAQVTVFRSADERAEDDARAIAQLLNDSGIPATLLDDSAPGVPQGAWEVCVDEADSARADAVIATHPLDTPIDGSPDLDMITVYRSGAGTTESEGLTVKGVLDAGGLDAEIVGDTRYPNLPLHVRVPREQVEEARRLIAEALAAGPSAAEEAEAESEPRP
jgi:hypothetical protein